MFRMLIMTMILYFLFGCTNTPLSDDDMNKILIDYENKLIQLQKEFQIPSISVAIVSNKQIIYSKGLGYADIERKIAATDSTPYRIVSTVLDLAKFDIALDNNELISNEMKELAFTPTKLNDGTEIPYGLGWFVGKYKDHRIVYHTGWQPSSSSVVERHR